MNKKFRMNPILKKELMVGSRSIKMSFAIMGINIFLTLIVLLVMAASNMIGNVVEYDYSALSYLFPILGCVECGLISLIVPIITSGSISGERERQTLDIMLTTPVSSFSIAAGKLGSAMMVVMMYMITSIPVMAIAFVLGGMSWWALLGLFGMILYLGIYVGSVGVFCSSVVKKSIMATILTIVIGVSIIVVTLVTFFVAYALIEYHAVINSRTVTSLGALPLILYLNPYSPIVDFFIRTMTSSSLGDLIEDAGSLPTIFKVIYDAWIPISIALNLLVSVGFLKLASVKIRITKNRK